MKIRRVTDEDMIGAMAMVAQCRFEKLWEMAKLTSLDADKFVIEFGEWLRQHPTVGWEDAAEFCKRYIQQNAKPPWR